MILNSPKLSTSDVTEGYKTSSTSEQQNKATMFAITSYNDNVISSTTDNTLFTTMEPIVSLTTSGIKDEISGAFLSTHNSLPPDPVANDSPVFSPIVGGASGATVLVFLVVILILFIPIVVISKKRCTKERTPNELNPMVINNIIYSAAEESCTGITNAVYEATENNYEAMSNVLHGSKQEVNQKWINIILCFYHFCTDDEYEDINPSSNNKSSPEVYSDIKTNEQDLQVS